MSWFNRKKWLGSEVAFVSEFDTVKVHPAMVAYKGGSGGSSGKVDKPPYLKDFHKWLMHEETSPGGGGISAAILDAREDNPYDIENNTEAEAYDPEPELTVIGTAAGTLETKVTGFVSSTEISTGVTLGVSEWNANLGGDSSYEELAVDDFEERGYSNYARSLNRFNAMAAGNGACLSSAFVLGRSNLENERLRSITDFRAQLSQQNESQRTQSILAIMTARLQGRNFEIDATREASRNRIEAERMKMVAFSEERTQNLEIEVQDSLWEIQLYQHGANVLAAFDGGTVTRNSNQSKLGTALGTAMVGASLLGMFNQPALGAAGGMMGLGGAAGSPLAALGASGMAPGVVGAFGSGGGLGMLGALGGGGGGGLAALGAGAGGAAATGGALAMLGPAALLALPFLFT
jgi:hypothetical protein